MSNRTTNQLRPTLSFNSANFAPKDQLDAFLPVSRGTVIPPDHTGIFDVRVNGWLCDNTAYVNSTYKTSHRPHRRMVMHNPDIRRLVLRKVGNVDCAGVIDGDRVDYRPGQIQIFPLFNEVDIKFSLLEQSSIYIPYERLQIDPTRFLLIFDQNTPIARVMGPVITGAFDKLQTASIHEITQTTDMICGMIDSLFAKKPPETAHQSMARARGIAMRAYILENLGDPTLSIDRIMQNFAASRATIYREFQRDGGIARFTMNERLKKAYRELARRPALRGQITTTAVQCGFWDIAGFSRAFRAQFGVTASDVLGSACEAEDGAAWQAAGNGVECSGTLRHLLAA